MVQQDVKPFLKYSRLNLIDNVVRKKNNVD